jgi:transcription elongation factor SPT5
VAAPEEEIAANIQARYRKDAQRQEEFFREDQRGRPSEMSKQGLLPRPGVDPSMWRVRCKQGKETLLVMSILNKAKYYAKKGRPLAITAAINSGLKGYVYVEAKNQADVSTALGGLNLVLGARLTMVPMTDMPAVLNVGEKALKKTPVINQWVRIKRGLYKDDLARVFELTDYGEKCIVEVVPRVDFGGIRLGLNTKSILFMTKGRPRPAARLFDAGEANNALKFRVNDDDDGYGSTRETVMHGNDPWGMRLECEILDGNYYHNGYLLKEVKPDTMLVWESVHPTLDEVARFGPGAKRDEDGQAEAMDPMAELAAAQKEREADGKVDQRLVRRFDQGDTVIVSSSELKGIVGKVVSTNVATGVVVMQPLSERGMLSEKIEMQAKTLAHYVSVGMHVKVLEGACEGETGMVQALHDRGGDTTVTILTDGARKEIEVRQAQVKESVEVAAGLDSLNGYELYDLVEFGFNQHGVITSIGRDYVTVLDNSNIVRRVGAAELTAKRNNFRIFTFDINDIKLQVGGPGLSGQPQRGC